MNCGDSTVEVCPLFREEGDGSIPISPLQFNIARCSIPLAINLVERWHSRLPYINESNVVRGGMPICFTADFANRFYATAIWTRPVAANRMTDGYNLLELRRLAINDMAPKNTASRMLKIMRLRIKKEFPNVVRLISYQDLVVHSGTIYAASGWVPRYRSTNSDWTTHKNKKRAGRVAQSDAAKMRWEFDL